MWTELEQFDAHKDGAYECSVEDAVDIWEMTFTSLDIHREAKLAMLKLVMERRVIPSKGVIFEMVEQMIKQ